MSEQETIYQASKNDRVAQGKLYEQYRVAWFMIAMRYNKNREDAMDVLQNALIKIYTKLNQFDTAKGNFKAWSSKIVVNESLMYLRKNANAFKVDDIDEVFNLEDEQEDALDILSAEELTKLIQKLPIGYRMVFNLYVIEGYTHVEISEMLKISDGTSKSQLFKAKKMLQKNLEVLI